MNPNRPLKGSTLWGCIGIAVFFAVSVSTLAQQPALQKIRLLCLNRPLPVVLAQSNGILTRYGIEVEFIVEPSSEALRSDLAAGKGDVAYIALDNGVAMVDSAGADVVIVMGGESSGNEIIVQPGIKSIADLRGRTVLVDAPNTAYALELKKVLLMNGLEPGKDYFLKPVGSTKFRLEAMREHPEYAASVMNPPFSILARHDGMASLGTMQTLMGADLDRGTFVMRSVGARPCGSADPLSRGLHRGATFAARSFKQAAGCKPFDEGVERFRIRFRRMVRCHHSDR